SRFIAATTPARVTLRGATRPNFTFAGNFWIVSAWAAAGALPTQRHQYQLRAAVALVKNRSLKSLVCASEAEEPTAVEAGWCSEETSSKLSCQAWLKLSPLVQWFQKLVP